MMDETRKFFCYLDEFDELTIIVPLKNYRDNNAYKLVGAEETVDLVVVVSDGLALATAQQLAADIARFPNS